MSDPKNEKPARSAPSRPKPAPKATAPTATPKATAPKQDPAARPAIEPYVDNVSSSPPQAPGAPKPDATGEEGLRKPEHRHFDPGTAPSDYQIDPTDRYRRIAVRDGGSGTRGSRKKKPAGESAGEVADAGASGSAEGPVPALEGTSVRPDSSAGLLDLTNSSLSSVPAVPNPLAPALHSASSEHSRDHRPLRIAHLYPSLLNVAGDGGNLIALQRRAQWRGIPVEIVAVEKGEVPDFRTFDIVLFHGGQDVEMAVAAADFALKAASLRAAVAEGVIVFAVCAGLQLLGHRYVSNAGEEMLGAGILDLETRGGPQRFMQHAACEVELNGVKETVVGFENHSGLTELGSGCEAFGRVIAGAGNNGRDEQEGARSGNVFATYLHGPVLPKNPWLTDQLIKIAVGRAEGSSPARVSLAPLDDTLEQRAHEVALAKAMANRGKRTALEPARLVRGQKAG
jgi:CobQ-like glutamine amidotransferase family enzyme